MKIHREKKPDNSLQIPSNGEGPTKKYEDYSEDDKKRLIESIRTKRGATQELTKEEMEFYQADLEYFKEEPLYKKAS